MNISLSAEQSPYASSWLKLSVASLIAAGLFAVLLVLSRAPGIQDIIPWIDFFHTALVVHVNLSVLIWFMSFSCLFWSLYATGRYLILDRLALYSCVAGTLILVVAPFLGAGKPLINNYIPVLQHPLFFWATGLFASGLLLQTVRVVLVPPDDQSGITGYAAYIAAIFTITSLIALSVSWLNVPADLEPVIYYEYLFWGGGHILQFSHTCLLLLSWLILARYCGGKLAFSPSIVKGLFIILLLPLSYAAYIYFAYDVFSPEHLTEFTALMKYGGLVAVPLGFFVFWDFVTSPYNKSKNIAAAKAALISSFILFVAGGILGFMINGVNLVIPAHYHGSIVGTTLAFMGVAYYLLPQMGYREPVWGIARYQPYIYGGGQLIQVIGWAIAGGLYDVQRKSAGAAQGLDSLPEIASIAMKVASAGGGISIIGGFLFWVVMIRSMWIKKAT